MEQKSNGNKPDLKGTLEVVAWWNTDSEGEIYLSVVLGNRVKLIKNEQKLEDQSKWRGDRLSQYNLVQSVR